MSRVAVVDIGTNSTRLLVAEPEGDGLRELARESIVTRLGEGVDATGRLGDEPQARVFRVLDGFSETMDAHGADARTVVMTSAVRDAANGAEFADAVRDRYGLTSSTLSGDEEARLSFLGATSTRAGDGALLVIDIGGGSTEMVEGERGEVEFHVSTQVGVVRHTERFLHGDPPAPGELEALAEAARETIAASVPAAVRERVQAAVAVAGTATQLAAIDLELDPYDRSRIEGHRLPRERLEALRDRLAAVPLAERRQITGLDPARAPTIVAGVAILLEVVGAFGLDGVEVSERDILWGVALDST
ncbi:MAG TPA: Ppx/GppA phosphatase family protein [Solirubrobacteraceae bacterium]|nr:Ppx/GppA phosphatase family protein [Solirubrobacteraceae bacterium]